MVFKVSACVITFNEEHNIEKCLKSMADIVDEIIVYDSGSADNTIKIAEKFTNKIYVSEWPGYGIQRNKAINKCNYDWILFLDADEVLSDRLKQEITLLLSSNTIESNNVYYFKWNTYFYGYFLRYGRFSNPQHKLFNKKQFIYKELTCHETLNFNNKKYNKIILNAPLLHYSWKNYEHLQQKYTNYSLLLAKKKFKKYQINPKYAWCYILYAIFRFIFDFVTEFFFNLSFLDGWFGFIISFNLAIYGFNKYVNLYLLYK